MLPAILLVTLALGLEKINASLAGQATLLWLDQNALKVALKGGMLTKNVGSVFHARQGALHVAVDSAMHVPQGGNLIKKSGVCLRTATAVEQVSTL